MTTNAGLDLRAATDLLLAKEDRFGRDEDAAGDRKQDRPALLDAVEGEVSNAVLRLLRVPPLDENKSLAGRRSRIVS